MNDIPKPTLVCVLLLAAALIGAAACGSSDDGPTTSATAAPPPTSTRSAGPTPLPGPGVTSTEIRLGMTNDLAGAGDTPYAAVSLAMQAYFTSINEEGEGVCGRDIKLLVEDDSYAPHLALAKTKALVEDREVLAMLGALSTQAHVSVAHYLNDPNNDGDTEDGVPDLFVSTGWSAWGDADAYPWTIGYIPGYWTDGAVLGAYVSENLPDQKLGVLYRDDAFGHDYLAGIEASLPGVDIEAKPFRPSLGNAGEMLEAMQDAEVEVLIIAGLPETTAEIIRHSAEIEYEPQFLVSYTSAPSQLASLVGGGSTADELLAGFQVLDGAITTQFLLSSIEDEQDEAVIEHRRIMETFDGPGVSSLSIYGQSLAELTVEALSRSCDDLTREGLLAAVESLDGVQTSLMLPGIEVQLGSSDHLAIEAMQPVMISGDAEVLPAGQVLAPDSGSPPPAPPTPTPAPTPSPTPSPTATQ